MKAIGYAGTFDLVTNGHMYVIGEARNMADRVEIYISDNPGKNPRFPVHVRKSVIERSVQAQGWDNVDVVVLHNEYTALAAKERGVDYLIRGIRNTADFDYENLIQQTNVDVLKGAKTVFVMAPRDLGSVSSSFVKMMQGPLGWHWRIKGFLPAPAYEAWLLDYLRTRWNALFDLSGFPSPTDRRAAVDTWFNKLCIDGYSAANRHYHNLAHIVHGVDEIFDWAYRHYATPRDVALLLVAFFFHDAVYGAHADVTDEEASAQLWLSSGLATHMGLTPEEVNTVASLIRTTDHFQGPAITHPLKDVMLGADLAILGQDYENVYLPYSIAVRQEYAHVSDEQYTAGRTAALQKLIAAAEQGTLFTSTHFAERYTRRALHNMRNELLSLGRN